MTGSLTPLHDELEAEIATVADDREVVLPARQLRALVAEAHGVEEAAMEAWIDA